MNMTCSCGEWTLLRDGLCGRHLPLWRNRGTLAGQKWLRQVPLRAQSPSPSSSLPAKNRLSHYHASDTEHHTREHAPARVSTQDMELCRVTGAGHPGMCGMRGSRHVHLQG